MPLQMAKKSAPGPKKPSELRRITRAVSLTGRREELKPKLVPKVRRLSQPKIYKVVNKERAEEPKINTERTTRSASVKTDSETKIKEKSENKTAVEEESNVETNKTEKLTLRSQKQEQAKPVKEKPVKTEKIEVVKSKEDKCKAQEKPKLQEKLKTLEKPKSVDKPLEKPEKKIKPNKQLLPEKPKTEEKVVLEKLDFDNINKQAEKPEIKIKPKLQEKPKPLEAELPEIPKSKIKEVIVERQKEKPKSPEKVKPQERPKLIEKPKLVEKPKPVAHDNEERAFEPRVSTRPSRKTKEAAALYMELLGRKLVMDTEIDDDNLSIDSFPELPNVKKTEQREIEMKAKVQKKDSGKIEKKKQDNVKRNKGESDSDQSDIKDVKKTKVTEIYIKESCNRDVKVEKKIDDNFSDSDEEPLVNLTKLKTTNVEKTVKKETVVVKEEHKGLIPLLSDDDEEKVFRGFIEHKGPKLAVPEKCIHIPSTDLLSKDIDRHFGTGKVNMSNEQIEQWIKDSAMAGSSKQFDKKVEDDFLKENIQSQIIKSKEEKDKCLLIKKEGIIKAVPESKECISKPSERRSIFQQRRLLNKERREVTPNTKAFSPNNESSVYAFETDPETPYTPFRKFPRRPSSTTTSRSEDDSAKADEDSKKSPGKFRMPQMFRPDAVTCKREVSLTLSTNEADNSASVAVQVNLDESFTESNINMECSTQTDNAEDDGDLFYIPLQPGKQSSSQVIQGVAVKLGTDSSGNHPRVVMHAKLVTQTPERLPILGSQRPQIYPPPVVTVQPTFRPKPEIKKMERPEETEFRYTRPTMPGSPSTSSSSSTKLYRRFPKPRYRNLEIMPVTSSVFPHITDPPQMVEAPTFHPTDKEFQDPMEFIEKIRPQAEKFGICRIIPPANFKPECKVCDDMRFTAYNQYVHKMLHRWGPNFKEMMAIKRYLKTQSITLTHPPWIGGMEIDLPRLYQTVQSLGGLKEVIEKKRWPKVAEGMKIPKSAQDRVTKLDDIYCKYLLPYDTLSPAEREKLFDEVETDWAKRESRTLMRMQQGTSATEQTDSVESEDDDECDECIVKGRNMALNAFYRIARNTMSMWFRTPEPTAQEVEQEFWKHVTTRQNHLCVHSGSIDSSGWGYGFCCAKSSPFARHPWNLKVFTNNSGSILRSMGPVMGVTVPTLHVGMVFSACCWYRDPHGLPWIEYLHTGANKIWYGIPDSFSNLFRSCLLRLVPNYCRNKTLWLPSDTAMVPPSLLVEQGMSLCRTVQEPGQFIVVFPKAFTSTVCSGYVVSESVYFAPPRWLETAEEMFRVIQDSCEPSMFSLERLILSIASDTRSSADVLKLILPKVQALKEKEQRLRIRLEALGLKVTERLALPENPSKRKRKLLEDDGEYECEICRANLYVSLVTDSQEEGIFCLEHAADHIEKKKSQLKYCKLMYTYDIEELDNVIKRVKFNIELKLQKKVPGKFAGMPTLLGK